MITIDFEVQEIAASLIEALYELDIEEMVFDTENRHDGLFSPKWIKALRSVGFEFFYGACRVVFTHPDLPQWVIKADYLHRAHYTAREVKKYQEAVEEGMDQYLLPVLPLGSFHGHEFFIAPKVVCGEYKMSDYLASLQDEDARDGLSDYLMDEACEDEICEYAFGCEDGDTLLYWLADHGIGDIHMGNIGLSAAGDIVIIDYAGWDLQEVYYD